MTNTTSLQPDNQDDWQRGYDAGLSGCTHYSAETLAFASGFLAGRAKREQLDTCDPMADYDGDIR